ncbi:MAG: YpoC family protein [Bacillota bacterium]
MEKLYTLPEEVKHPYFYSETETMVSMDAENLDLLHPVFSYEILYYNNVSHFLLPWENPFSLKKAEGVWGELSVELNAAFSSRDSKKVKSLMNKASALFLMYLFWTNGRPANPSRWKEELEVLSLKPVNASERLEFVLMQPALFHSYKQLNQLFIEQVKQFAKHMAVRKHRT